ncbi:MAG: phosphate acetyltransferase [Austwickia sp.]|nr:phosphate acetyltransferase [Austwickia sp.]MBK8436668.1 phosphate acetyltransferase [Austwickia sp.]
MTRRILVVPINQGSGLTATCLGLAHALDDLRVNVGYVKPLAQPRHDGGDDHSGELVRLTTPLRPPSPVPATVTERLLAEGHLDALMQEALTTAEEVIRDHDLVIIEGLVPSADQTFADRLNVALAKAMDADVLLVGSAHQHSPHRLADQMAAMDALYRVREGSRVVGVVINRIPSVALIAPYKDAVTDRGIEVAAAVEMHRELAYPRVRDVVRQLGLSVVSHGDQDRRIHDIAIAAQSVPGFLSSLTADRMVIVPGDRHEVLMAAGLCEMSGTKLAAILLTAGARPDPQVLELCRPALDAGLPVLLTPEKTFETANQVIGMDPDVPADDGDRARMVTRVVGDRFDEAWLRRLPGGSGGERVTAAQFRLHALQLARRGRRQIALPEGFDPRVLAAAVQVNRNEIADLVIIGEREAVADAAAQSGLALPTSIRVMSPSRADHRHAQRLIELRPDAGLDQQSALVQLRDPLLFALITLSLGDVDGVVGGAVLDRRRILELAKELIGTRSDIALVASEHFLLLPDQVVVYADCSVNAEPNAAELASIAAQAATSAESLGIHPRVAFISADLSTAGSHQDLDRVTEATALLRERRPDLAVDGPLAYGAAASPSLASLRAPDSPVAGRATVFVFPDLRTGRTTYHAVRRSAGVDALGPLLLGLSAPVNSVARDATADEIADAILMTALQAARA